MLAACQSVQNLPTGIKAATTVRTINVAPKAWSGSSVNVLANVRQTLFTDSVYQYTAYYDENANLTLGKRRIGQDTWQLAVTQFTGNVEDAHNHISLVVDGAGYIHISWDQHNSSLKYAQSVQPGSLFLRRTFMLNKEEKSVTYPQFYRLNNGDLLFQYRHGGSGNGNLVLNRYSIESQSWSRVHNNLLDGEDQRSAYWDMNIDSRGVLHLAWIWRETPDVASNHDLNYAQSTDNGETWQSITGERYTLPMSQQTVSPVLTIGQNHNLMNPPVIAADNRSRPYIASYWSDIPGANPTYGVLSFINNKWTVFRSTPSQQAFSLSGKGTKSPPWSRPTLLVESDWQNSWFHLVYRDNSKNAIMVSTVKELSNPRWNTIKLLDWPKDGWEPTYDPQQWQRMKQLHMLVQHVQQIDGNDTQGADVPSQALKLLIWSPFWERSHSDLQSSQKKLVFPQQKPLNQQQIIMVAKKAAQWQWDNIPQGWNYHPRAWAVCPLYIGSLAIDKVIPDAKLADKVRAIGQQQNWQPHDRHFDADDYCVSQAYLSLYQIDQDLNQLTPSKKHLDYILNHLPTQALDWGTPHSRDRWSWSDALFMGPVAWLQLYKITGDQRYVDFANQEWWATYERLYSAEIGLYFRDESYLDLREQNGQTIHWARGTGWSIAGLARAIALFPQSHPDYPRYIQQFKQMALAFKNAQQSDGLWRPGLLDPVNHDAAETSGSAFALFALAWGMNQGLLNKNDYLPVVELGWSALSHSVQDNGKLIHVQPIGASPEGFNPQNAEPFATGALLLAASEVFKLVN